ncbi:transposase [Paenibacillus sp. TH7-28]
MRGFRIASPDSGNPLAFSFPVFIFVIQDDVKIAPPCTYCSIEKDLRITSICSYLVRRRWLSKVIQYLKGRSSRLLQDEFSHLKKWYWGQHLRSRGYFCVTVGAINEDTISRYIEDQQVEDEKAEFQSEHSGGFSHR